VFYRVEVRTLCRPVKFFHTQLAHLFIDLALCTGAQSCWNRKGPFPDCFPKVGSMKLSKNWSIQSSFHWAKASSWETTPHHNPPLHQTLHMAQCSQTSTVLLATVKPRLVHQIAWWRSVISHSREVAVCFTPLHTTLCNALVDVQLECSCSDMETHSMKLSTHSSWADLKATWSKEVCSDLLCRKLATSAHYALQYPLTPLCHFTWPTTSWLSCCCSQSLPLCYNTTDSWLWNI